MSQVIRLERGDSLREALAKVPKPSGPVVVNVGPGVVMGTADIGATRAALPQQHVVLVGSFDDERFVGTSGLDVTATDCGAAHCGSLESAERALIYARARSAVLDAFEAEFRGFRAGGAATLRRPMAQVDEERWPVTAAAVKTMRERPLRCFQAAVQQLFGGQYDRLREKRLLVVGATEDPGLTEVQQDGPVMELVRYLRLEGARVDLYDMFVKELSQPPALFHNSGRPVYDGVLVLHPYQMSTWEQLDADSVMRLF